MARTRAAGRPRRTPGKAVPPVTGGQLRGSMRTRGGVDTGVNLKGNHLEAPRPAVKNPGGNRA